MSEAPEDKKGKWWQSPAALAAIASLITAVAALVGALHGNGPA